jgi:hypothetical protein
MNGVLEKNQGENKMPTSIWIVLVIIGIMLCLKLDYDHGKDIEHVKKMHEREKG